MRQAALRSTPADAQPVAASRRRQEPSASGVPREARCARVARRWAHRALVAAPVAQDAAAEARSKAAPPAPSATPYHAAVRGEQSEVAATSLPQAAPSVKPPGSGAGPERRAEPAKAWHFSGHR